MNSTGNRKYGYLPFVLFLCGAAVVLLLFTRAFTNLKAGSGDEAVSQLESAIRQAVVTCYATEGYYPPDMDYIVEHYGIQLDESRYLVSYDIFAENIMPEITVIPLAEETGTR